MLSKKEVEHIANLAKLELSEEEKEKIAPELSDILGYIEHLEEVDVTNVLPTAQVTGQANVFREDVIDNSPADEKAAALGQTPYGLAGNQIKVKRVLE